MTAASFKNYGGSDDDDAVVFHEEDRVNALHPLFVIPHSSAEEMRSWYETHPDHRFGNV